MDIQTTTLITGVIGEDVHVTGIRILEHALRSAGFNVVSLGIHNTQEDFIKTAIEHKASVILISSLCGHAEFLVDGIRDRCKEHGIPDILLYLGGQLSINAVDQKDLEKVFLDFGFNRVYPPFVLPNPVIADIKHDLNLRGK